MPRSHAREMVAVAALAAAGLAACGGDDGGTAEPAATVASGVLQGVGDQMGTASTVAGTETAPAPASMQEWEALWAEERAAIVERITTEQYGISADGTTLNGPSGYTADLSGCPAGWSNTEGISDTEIRIGWPGPLSGPLADFGGYPKGAKAVLDAYSDAGVFVDANGTSRSVNMTIRDDAYDPARLIALTDELIDSERVMTLISQSTPGALAVYGSVNERCVPHIITTGHPAWADPVNHPWSTPHLLSYSTEAVLWGTYIEQHLDEWGGTATVAGLVMTNDFGTVYENALRAFIAQSPRKDDIEFVTETLEPTAPTVKDQMTTLNSKDPDVFIAMTAGTSCTQAITEAAENGMKEALEAAFLPSVCKASSNLAKDKVGGDGSVSDGWRVIGGGVKDFNNSEFDDDPWVVWARQQLTAAGEDYHSSSNLTFGAWLGWQISQALLVAGELPGGLTRTNLALAWRAMDMTSPALVEGVQFKMDGNADAALVEGSDLSQWNAAEQRWEVRDVIDINGQSGLCPWDSQLRSCGTS